VKVEWYHSSLIFVIVVVVTLLLLFPELWDTLPCNLPNPSFATYVTALRFVATPGII
jgi:hypothetical protein